MHSKPSSLPTDKVVGVKADSLSQIVVVIVDAGCFPVLVHSGCHSIFDSVLGRHLPLDRRRRQNDLGRALLIATDHQWPIPSILVVDHLRWEPATHMTSDSHRSDLLLQVLD